MRVDRSVVLSASLHVLVIGVGMVSFASRPHDPVPTESMPVDILSLSEFSQITRGQKTAPKADTPRQVAEKVAGEVKPPDTDAKKISDKPPVETQAAAPPPPLPPKIERPPDPPKAEAKPPEPKAEEKAEVPKPPERPKALTPPPRPPERPQLAAQPSQVRAYDASQIAALLDRRDPTRAAATGPEISRTATLGAASGRAATLSQSEIDALRAQIQRCWNPPVGAADARDLIVQVRLSLNLDGSLAAQPVVINRGATGAFQVASESALRAVRRCAPYTLPAAKYDAWRDVEVTFDPREMLRG